MNGTVEPTTAAPAARAAATAYKERAESAAPSVFDFKNYREYLAAWFEWRKEVQSNYSGALFAKKAGLASHTLLGMVIRGQRNLSYSTMRAFARALALKSRELKYFEHLVFFNQAKTAEDKSFHLEQLRASGGTRGELVTKFADYADYLSHWYIVAIREMIHLADFDRTPEWIAKRLKGKITPKQAEAALQTLLRLKLIEEDPQTRRLNVLSPSLDIEPGVVDFAVRNFHKEYLERTREAIDHEPIDERELSSFTLCVSDAQLELLKTRIRDFRKQLNQEFFGNGKDTRSHVVAINTQALILTQIEREKESKK